MSENKLQDRQKKIYKSLFRRGLDGLLVTNKPNVSYLSGLRQMEAYLLLSTAGNYYITNFLYLEEVKEKLPSFFNLIELKGPLSRTLNRIARKHRLKRLGFEPGGLDYRLYKRLKDNATNFHLFQTDNLVEGLRQVKDESELKLIRHSIKIAASAWKTFLEYLRPKIDSGIVTEKEAADRLEYLLRQYGAAGGAFDIISASGANASWPHAKANNVVLNRSQPILFDFGAVYQEYHCDMTRVFSTGKVTGKYRQVYQIVRQAQQMAIKAIKPGEKICNIDCISRSYITSKGLDKYFGHGLGHGIGLEVHEAPSINKSNRKRLKPGMVFTIEPGVYIPGWGGVRIEDMVVVTQRGCEVLTDDINKSI